MPYLSLRYANIGLTAHSLMPIIINANIIYHKKKPEIEAKVALDFMFIFT